MPDKTDTLQQAAAEAAGGSSAPAATAAPAKVANSASAVSLATDAAIEAWFVEEIHNSPASRDTAIFNHVRQAVDLLKQRLAAL